MTGEYERGGRAWQFTLAETQLPLPRTVTVTHRACPKSPVITLNLRFSYLDPVRNVAIYKLVSETLSASR